MENNISKLDELMSRKPFRVPDGYFENFTEKIMSQLPEKQAHSKDKKVRLFERVRPWLVAAVFTGLVTILFVYTKKTDNTYADADKDMIVKNISSQTIAKPDEESYADTDFFEYLAEEYSNNNAEEYIDNLVN
jgi:hypothetical protein